MLAAVLLCLYACNTTPEDTSNVPTDSETTKDAQSDTAAPEVNWDGIEIADAALPSDAEAYSGAVYAEWKAADLAMYKSGETLYFPLSALCAALGIRCDISGDAATVYSDRIISLKAGAGACFIDGEKTALEQTVKNKDGALYVCTDAFDALGFSAGQSSVFGGLVISAGKSTASVSGSSLLVDKQTVPAVMYSGTQGSQYTWFAKTQKIIGQFASAGVNIIQNDIWLKDIWGADGSLDVDLALRQIDGALQANPNAKLVLRLNLSAPGWWTSANPSEQIVYTAGATDSNDDTQKSVRVSLASEKWYAETTEVLKRFCRELKLTPEGDRVIGLHLGGGVYGEWHYYGFFYEPDGSEPMKAKFISYAKEKYKTLDALNAARGKNYSSFDEITVPSYDERYAVTDGDLRDPTKEAYTIDYYMCQAKVVSDDVCGFAKTAQEAWGRDTLIGVFYGYLYGGSDTVGSGGETVGATASQMDIEAILNCEYIDYVSGPYAARSLLSAGFYRSLCKSCALNGKIFISENDQSTFLGDNFNNTYPLLCRDEIESIAVMRRNYMYTLTEGAGTWYYDFGPSNTGGAWSTELMMKEAASLCALSVKQTAAESPAVQDVLVVYDMNAYYYAAPITKDAVTPKLNATLTNELFKTGASFDRIFLSDLQKVDISQYKTVIFTSTYRLDASQRDYIKGTVMKNGRHVVFMSAAGYTDGETNSVGFISSLTGLNIVKVDDLGKTAKLRIDGNVISGDGIKTLFAVEDSSAENLADYSGTDVCGAAKKTTGDCTVWYFGIPASNADVLKSVFNASGSVICSEGDGADYISVGGGMICIYSKNGGKKTLTLSDGSKLEVTMEKNNTMFYSLSDGSPLTYAITEDSIPAPEETEEESQAPDATGEKYGMPADFKVKQGWCGWYHMYKADGEYYEMVYRSDFNAYGISADDDTFCLSFKDRLHPGKDADAVKRWVVQKTGKVQITTENGGIKLPSVYSDGVIVSILYNGASILRLPMAPGDVYTDSLVLEVFEGDVISFEVNCLNKNNDDTVEWSPMIVYYE